MSLLICVRFPNGRFSSDPHNQHDVCLAIISPWPTHLIQYNRRQISHYEGFHLLYTGLFKKNWTLSKIYYCSVTVVKTGAFCWRKYQFKPYIYIYIFKKNKKQKKTTILSFFLLFPTDACQKHLRINIWVPLPPTPTAVGQQNPRTTNPAPGHYIPTTRTHNPRLICLGDSSHHISAPSYIQSFLIYTL